MTGVVGILLAAGRARRFGADKLCARLPGGLSVLETSAAQLAAAVDEVIAVTPDIEGSRAALLRAAGIAVVPCTDAALGMAHSLAAGVAARPDARAWLVALADMPFIEVATCERLAAALQAGASVVVPVYAGRDGNPVGFAATWREALLGLAGDRGARALVESAGAAVVRVAVDDPGIVRDIDVPADLPRGGGEPRGV